MATIKEKVLKAWAKDLEITVCFDEGSELTGYICEFRSNMFAVEYQEGHSRAFEYEDVTGIRFVDEGEEGSENPCLYHGCNRRDECTEIRLCSDFKTMPSPPEPERWERAGHDIIGISKDDNYQRRLICTLSDLGNIDLGAVADLISAAPQLRNALRMVKEKYDDCREKYPDGRSLHLMFSPHHYETITDALKKAGV